MEIKFINPRDFLSDIINLWSKYYNSEPYNFNFSKEESEKGIMWRLKDDSYKWIGVFEETKLICIYSFSRFYDIYPNLWNELWNEFQIPHEKMVIIRTSVNHPDYRLLGVTSKVIHFMENHLKNDYNMIIAPVYDLSLIDKNIRQPKEFYGKKHNYQYFKSYSKESNYINENKNCGIPIDLMLKIIKISDE